MSHSNLDHLSAPSWLWRTTMAAGVLTVAFGGYGLWLYEEHHHAEKYGFFYALSTSLYHALQMLILHTPHFHEKSNVFLEIGRWLGALTLVLATGALLWKRLRAEIRIILLNRWKDHHVVCGLGQKGMGVVRSLKKDSKARVVAIDPHPDESHEHECEVLGVPLLREDATKPKVLGMARVNLASEVIVISPDDEKNMSIASAVRAASESCGSGAVNCFVHLSNIHLRERLQMLADRTPGKRAACRLAFFDVFDDEARRLLANFPLDGKGIPEGSHTTVHVVILGFGRMGRSLALRAAKMGHFANRKPIRISVIDRDAGRREEQFLFRYPALDKTRKPVPALCELDFHEADAESLRARQWIESWAAETDTLLHLFVCLEENSGAMEFGLRLQEALAGHPRHNLQVRIKTHTEMTDILKDQSKPGPVLNIFGQVEDRCREDAFRREQNQAYAMAAHGDFVARRKADSSRGAEQDPALDSWENLQEDLRESNRQQADHAKIKLRAIGCEMVGLEDLRDAVQHFSDDEINLLAEIEHSRWNAERFLSGWRYGKPSDKSLRINENLVSWDDLPDHIRSYDRETVTNIPSILARMHPPMKVVRRSAV